MMKTDEILGKWEALRKSKEYQQRLDPDHPLDFFVGVDVSGKDELILITDEKPVRFQSSKEIKIETRMRESDKRWVTLIILEDKHNSEIFAKLCLDLMEVSRNSLDEAEGVAAVIYRFIAWQKLFARNRDGLSEKTIKGLVGELMFAKNVLCNISNISKVVAAWEGPKGGDRDFVFEDTWYEIKSIATGKNYITISSLNQLEIDRDGYIVQYFVDSTSEMEANSFPINALVNDIRNLCRKDPLTLMVFDNKLIELGYISDNPKYDEMYFTCSEPNFYKVSTGFPRLTPSNIPEQIINAQYDISLASIESWKVEKD